MLIKFAVKRLSFSGCIAMEKRDFKTGSVEEQETEDDVSRDWDSYPEFGDYLHLLLLIK